MTRSLVCDGKKHPAKYRRNRYDPDGNFVRHWIPELAGLSGGRVHAPFHLEVAERAALVPDYPPPCPGAVE